MTAEAATEPELACEGMIALTPAVAKRLLCSIVDRLGPGGLLALPTRDFRLLSKDAASAWTEERIGVPDKSADGADDSARTFEFAERFLDMLAAVRAIEGETPLLIPQGRSPVAKAA